MPHFLRSGAYIAKLPYCAGRRLYCQLPRQFGIWTSSRSSTSRDYSENHQHHQQLNKSASWGSSPVQAHYGNKTTRQSSIPRSIDSQRSQADHGQGLSRVHWLRGSAEAPPQVAYVVQEEQAWKRRYEPWRERQGPKAKGLLDGKKWRR